MKAAKIQNINIRQSHLGVTAIVTCDSGYVYAVRYAPDAVVTESLIRKSWKENRWAFRPYDEGTDCFVS